MLKRALVDYCLMCLTFMLGLVPIKVWSQESLWETQSSYELTREVGASPSNWTSGRSLLPNELNLADFESLWKLEGGVQHKAYLSVGSERAFIGASLSRLGYLVGIDFDPSIVKFNKLNARVLALSESRSDYLTIRFFYSYSELEKKMRASLHGLGHITESEWNWWQKQQHTSSWRQFLIESEDHSKSLMTADRNLSQFKTLFYWNNDQNWFHLRELARSRKMAFYQLDLNHSVNLELIMSYLSHLGIKPGIFDSSNTLDYIGSKVMARAVKIIGKGLEPQDFLKWISTSINPVYKINGSGTEESFLWHFEGRNFGFWHLSSEEKIQEVVSSRRQAESLKAKNFCSRTHLDPL